MKKIIKLGFSLCMVLLLVPIMNISAAGKSIDDYFSRPQTAKAVAQVLKKTDDITENDLRTVKSLSLYEDDGHVSFDSDLGKLENLESLSIANTGWTSLDGIEVLQNSLTSLSLSNLPIEDIAALESLMNLKSLTFTEQSDITHNAIASNENFLVPVENLKLNTFTSFFSPFSDEHLVSLSKIESLTSLTLKHSMVTTIVPIANLTDLKTLNLSDAQLTNLDGVESMHNLSTLNVSVSDRGRERNQITDFSALTYPYSETGVRRKLSIDGLTPMLTMSYDTENDVYFLDLDCIVPPTASVGYEPLKLSEYDIPYYGTFDDDGRVVYDNEHVEEIINSGHIDFSAGNFLLLSSDRSYDAQGVMWMRINAVDLPELVYHTVTFNSNDGSEVTSQSILDKEKVAQPEAPIREGYTFDGWFQDSALEQAFDFDTVIEADLTLHAKWSKIDVYHTVTFNSNDGSEVTSQSILDKEKVAQPEAPIREGYTFDGWFQDSALEQAFDFDTIIESDLTLHAKWNKIDVYHTVTFNSNDGNEIASQSILDKEKVAQPEAPIREGYTFDGWFQDSALQQAFDFDTIIESDLTLHAKWNKIDVYHTVTFNSNDGNEIASQS
ncbi:InlB B-repeat-containing protein, partial [Erysipelothrix anatis]|uniref:InlB B-repeat-containing protein n=2 Tax=Erysipelothrix anatis TaxID=2683713 RepID=UPI001915E1A1